MTARVASEAEVIHEASQVLLRHLSPAKAARFWAIWRTGQGDYLQWRDDAFSGESVDSLYEQIEQYQTDMANE